MKIQVNGEAKTYDKDLTVKEVLVLEKVNMPDYVSVQINGDFLDRSEYDTHLLKEGDEVEFLYFMGGGQNFRSN